MHKKNVQWPAFLGLFSYFYINFLLLLKFPFIHSDELWLLGLSKAYLKVQSLMTTEPFFDLVPRQSHALKWLFHSIQGLCLYLFPTIEPLVFMRALSLTVGCMSLVFFFLAVRTRTNGRVAVGLTLALGLHPQVVMAFHMARQEVFLFLGVTFGLWLCSRAHHSINWVAWLAVTIGMSIFIHPNALLLAALFFPWVMFPPMPPLYHRQTRARWQQVLMYVIIIGLFAGFAICLSLVANPSFISDYWEFGKTHRVNAAVPNRFSGFVSYWAKLWLNIEGSYYTVSLKGLLALIGAMTVSTLFIKRAPQDHHNHHDKQRRLSLLSLLGYMLATFVIGRYNPTAVVLMLPHAVIWLAATLNALVRQRVQLVIFLVLFAAVGLDVFLTARDLQHRDYLDFWTQDQAYFAYIEAIDAAIPDTQHKPAAVLGNLSAEAALSENTFFDIRNLGYLQEKTVEHYLASNDIRYILYYEEYDYIINNPEWVLLYDVPVTVLKELQAFVLAHGQRIADFESPLYGTRISDYRGVYPWRVTIYAIESVAAQSLLPIYPPQ